MKINHRMRFSGLSDNEILTLLELGHDRVSLHESQWVQTNNVYLDQKNFEDGIQSLAMKSLVSYEAEEDFSDDPSYVVWMTAQGIEKYYFLKVEKGLQEVTF